MTTLKLWLLRPVEGLPEGQDPWIPPHDKVHQLVIRAETEDQARSIANDCAGDENFHWKWKRIKELDPLNPPWKSPKYSTCIELSSEGEVGVIICEDAIR